MSGLGPLGGPGRRPKGAPMTRIVLHIDRLVLRGVERGDAGALAAALRGALQEQLADPAAAAGLVAGPAAALLRAAPVTLAPGGDAAVHGRAIGQAIAHQLNPGDAR